MPRRITWWIRRSDPQSFAESDGVVYQRRRPSRPEPAARMPEHSTPDAQKPAPTRQATEANAVVSSQHVARSADAPNQMVEEYIRDTIIRQLSASLKMDMAKIVADEPFADYGIDSLTGVHVVQVLNSLLKTDLETISLFDYDGHIFYFRGSWGMLGTSAPPSSPKSNPLTTGVGYE